MSAILVVAEHRDGALRESTMEALGAALELGGAAGMEVIVAVLAADPEGLAEPLRGVAPKLRLVAHPDLAEHNPELYAPPLLDMVAALGVRLVVMGHTSQGMDLGPTLAARLGAPVVTDCTAVAAEGEGALTVRRKCYGGKVDESLTLEVEGPVVLTLQGGAFQAAAGGLETETEQESLTELAPRHLRRFLERAKAAVEDVDIAAADILISVGRGIGTKENIALAEALAAAAGGTVSCSRPVADAGWLPQSRQVGTSGKTVRPKLYVALGISGAFQHVAGMKGAETILAVNKDPRAPIFQVAHYGIVEDVTKVVPALTEKLRG